MKRIHQLLQSLFEIQQEEMKLGQIHHNILNELSTTHINENIYRFHQAHKKPYQTYFYQKTESVKWHFRNKKIKKSIDRQLHHLEKAKAYRDQMSEYMRGFEHEHPKQGN